MSARDGRALPPHSTQDGLLGSSVCGGVGADSSGDLRAIPERPWCPCFQRYQPDSSACVVNRCAYRFPSHHPELWVDDIHDAVGGVA